MSSNPNDIMMAFDFIEQDDFIHRLDPRTKFIFAILYMILLIMIKWLIAQFFLFILLIPFIIIGHLIGSLLKSIRAMSFLFFFIILLNTIFASFNFSLIIAIRFLNILVVFSILFRTTNPDDLTQAFTRMGMPFYISFSISLAFRFVPTLAKETQFILEAQKSRGYDINVKGFFQQIKNLFPIIIPLIFNSYQRAFYIAESLESRSFGVKGIKRTYLYPIKMKTKDYIIVALLIFIFILGILIHNGIISMPIWFYYKIPL
ncbi:MAG: energy-coupling factor transporter transmembrane component T family protein [Promethearchaeota archaeon]